MKKIVIFAAVAIAALSACTKEVINSPEENNTPEVTNSQVFTATLEGTVSTKTTLIEGSSAGKKMVAWSDGDKISINGVTYTTSSTESTASFTSKSADPEMIDGKYIAVYPSTISVDLTSSTLTLPATQIYDPITNGISNVPMVAVSTSTSLEFKNICSVLAIKVASGTVKKIKVMADKKNLSGNFTLNQEDFSISATSGENNVVLDCGDGVTADNTIFYIAIPPQEYSSLQIYISSDGETYKEAMATKKAEGLGTFLRNKIFNIDYQKNAEQIWAGGPYFATMNLGETSETGTSAKYLWGATEAGGSENAGDYDLDHDTAYKIWGTAWRMPSQLEYTNLKLNTDVSKAESEPWGFTFTSKTAGYGSLFLPSLKSTGYTYYWSATVSSDSGRSYCLSMDYDNSTPRYGVSYSSSILRNSERLVRAVLNTPEPAPYTDPNLLSGNFSVSSDKIVKFTNANLYWDGSDYKLENRQEAFEAIWEETHICHFFWTTTAESSYAATYDSAFSASSGNFWLDGSDDDHKITVNGTSGLYVLSLDEWKYLLNSRSQTYRYAKARVQSVNGLLIFPNGYSGTASGTGIATANLSTAGYPSENIPTETWTEMETAGVVFLPAASERVNINMSPSGVNSEGCYLSASSYNGLYFREQGLYFNGFNSAYGHSIRLVK